MEQGPKVFSSSRKALEKLERTHPASMMISLMIIAASAFFLYLMATYCALKDMDGILVTKEIFLGALILLLPSYPIANLTICFKQEQSKRLLLLLALSILATLSFLLLQVIAWQEFFGMVSVSADLADKIIMLIIVIHFLMTAAIAIQMIFLSFHFLKTLKNPVQQLVVFSNPFERLRLVLLRRVFVFAQYSWIFSLVLVLLF